MGEFQSGQMGQTVNLLFRLRWFESTLSHQKSPRYYVSRTFLIKNKEEIVMDSVLLGGSVLFVLYSFFNC